MYVPAPPHRKEGRAIKVMMGNVCPEIRKVVARLGDRDQGCG